jgi:hypothetical protein
MVTTALLAMYTSGRISWTSGKCVISSATDHVTYGWWRSVPLYPRRKSAFKLSHCSDRRIRRNRCCVLRDLRITRLLVPLESAKGVLFYQTRVNIPDKLWRLIDAAASMMRDMRGVLQGTRNFLTAQFFFCIQTKGEHFQQLINIYWMSSRQKIL